MKYNQMTEKINDDDQFKNSCFKCSHFYPSYATDTKKLPTVNVDAANVSDSDNESLQCCAFKKTPVDALTCSIHMLNNIVNAYCYFDAIQKTEYKTRLNDALNIMLSVRNDIDAQYNALKQMYEFRLDEI